MVSCPFTGYRNETSLSSFYYVNQQITGAFTFADDLTLDATGTCEVTSYELAVWGGGGGPFDVTASLYTGCPGSGGTEIAGTNFTWQNVPDNGSVQFLTETPASVPIANDVWIVATFSTPESGWIIGGEAETGFTADLFGLDVPPWVCNTSFGGTPYAGLWLVLECE